jgi:hypothetical protein
MASEASINAVNPLVSIIPKASAMLFLLLPPVRGVDAPDPGGLIFNL